MTYRKSYQNYKYPGLYEKQNVWESDLIILEEVNIEIHEDLLKVMDELNKKYHGFEFSIVCKAEKTDNGYIVGKEYMIPEQTVTSGNVKLEEEIDPEWNAIIHKHPSGLHTFSATDVNSINAHFKVSILYCDNSFVAATVSVKDESHMYLIPASTSLYYERIEVDAEGKIKEYTYPAVNKYDRLLPKIDDEVSGFGFEKYRVNYDEYYYNWR